MPWSIIRATQWCCGNGLPKLPWSLCGEGLIPASPGLRRLFWSGWRTPITSAAGLCGTGLRRVRRDSGPMMNSSSRWAAWTQVSKPRSLPELCGNASLPPALKPKRQHELTILAVFSFLQSSFHPIRCNASSTKRALANNLVRENPELEVSLDR